VPRFYQIFETDLSAQLHKQHGRHASAISSYTFVEQKVSKQQLIKVSLLWLNILFKSANPAHSTSLNYTIRANCMIHL